MAALPLMLGEAPMGLENYRYYCLDSAGRLHDAALFDAENDQDAIAKIEAKHPNDKCEIWQGKRLVATLSPKRLSA